MVAKTLMADAMEKIEKLGLLTADATNPFYVLCVDDERDQHNFISKLASQFGFQALCATSASEAIDLIKRYQSQMVYIVSDFRMAPTDGFELRKQILDIAPEIPFLILSGHITKEMALTGIELKISGFLDKPVNENEFASLIIKEAIPRLQSIKEDQELLLGFLDEAELIIEQAEEIALSLENDLTNIESINKCFGLVHTLKGSSGYFKPKTLHQFIHRFEDLLKKLQRGECEMTPDVVSIMLKSIDFIKVLLKEFRTQQHGEHNLEILFKELFESQDKSSKAVTQVAATKDPGQKSVAEPPAELRVAVNLLDSFMQASGEMTVIRNMLNKCVKSIELQFPGNKEVDMLSELLEELHTINGGIQNQIVNLRKVPFHNIIKPIHRVFRDVTKSLGKQAELFVIGEDLAVDTAIAGALNNSLIHLIRNSLDHGLEAPEEREKNGKAAKGKVTITAAQKNDTIIISIEDDGRGINEKSIQKKLIKNGTHSEEQAAQLSKPELFAMIFESGFSTAEKVTDVSGRGVGMSMVKDCVKALGGHIDIESANLKGTKFHLNLPIPKSVLIRDCLFVLSQGRLFGIPQDDILRVIQTTHENQAQIFHSLDALTVDYDGQLVPVIELSELLEQQKSAETSNINNIVLIGHGPRTLGIKVDSILDIEDTVIKQLQGPSRSIHLFQGAAHMGDGNISLILSVEGLINKSGIQAKVMAKAKNKSLEQKEETIAKEHVDLMLFKTGNRSLYGIPNQLIYRIEEINSKDIYKSGKDKLMPYRDKIMSLVDLGQLLPSGPGLSKPNEDISSLKAIVIEKDNNYYGLTIQSIDDVVSVSGAPLHPTAAQFGIAGNYIVKERVVSLINLDEILQSAA